jgi:soluble cytochrome b562
MTPDYRQYRRTAIAEMADWYEGFDMFLVSVSQADRLAGSPKAGDKIARNPANHADQWLVAAAYFAANFEPEDQA